MKPVYHIVSHSHWDREWYKSFEQFRSMLVNMVDDLLDLLEHDPEYVCFTLDGQTVVLDDYLAVRPEREPELRRLVRQGRLMIGPWYILPDEFLVSAEATVRNLLAGTRRSRDFGAEMKVGYIPDSFGHIAMMPAILSGFGIDTALLYRGFGGEPGQNSSEYWWTGPDGTRCLMLHLFRHGYSAAYFHQESDEQILDRFKGLKEEVDARAATSHRLLMNGGDHHWPDPKLPKTLALLRKNFDGEFVHSSVPQYAAAVKKEVNGLPEISGELRFGYRYAFVVIGGVYSSRMYLKQQNWEKQLLLQRYVEPLNAYATAGGMRSQLPLVRHAWQTLMQNHPHDSICGCSIDPVHREMMTRFKAVEDVGNSVLQMSLNHIIPYDDLASGDDRRLYFFNPSPFARSGVAEADLSFYLQDIVVGLNPDVKVAPRKRPVTGFSLHDPEGKEVPYQIVSRGEGYDITYTNYNYPKQTYAENFRLLVEVKDVPPVGFKGFTVERQKKFSRYPTTLRCGRNFIENDHLRVEANQRGEVTMKDKTHGRTFSRLNVFEDSGDVGDEYNYSYPRKDRWVYSNKGKARVELIEQRAASRGAPDIHGDERACGSFRGQEFAEQKEHPPSDHIGARIDVGSTLPGHPDDRGEQREGSPVAGIVSCRDRHRYELCRLPVLCRGATAEGIRCQEVHDRASHKSRPDAALRDSPGCKGGVHVAVIRTAGIRAQAGRQRNHCPDAPSMCRHTCGRQADYPSRWKIGLAQ